MGFELPLALLGLLGVSAPIAAHLMRRRDLPVIALPTVMLLERAQARSQKRVHLVDLLLLAARILLVVALAVAVADPYVTVQLAYGDGRLASVAIVLDDSMSMERQDAEGHGLLSDEAREMAADAIASLPIGSEVSVVLAGHPPRLLVPRTSELDEAAAAVESLESAPASARGTDLPTAVARAVRELAAARIDKRRLLIITDGAAHARLEDVRFPGDEIAVDLRRLDGVEENRAIASAHAVPDPTTPGQVSVAVEIRAHGPAGASVVHLKEGGEEVSHGAADLSSGVARVNLHAPAPDEGTPTALITLDGEDAISVDDERAVLLRPNAALRVLIVDGDPHDSRDRDEVGYLVRALDLSPSEGEPLSYRVVDPDTAEATDLAGWDVVVLANVRTPSAHGAARLADFVEGGGGLLIAAGDRMDPAEYRARFGELLPGRPRAVGALPDPLSLLRAEGASQRIPTGGLESVQATRRLVVEAAPQSETLLRFEDGSDALLLAERGEGRVGLLALPVDTAWSDLPYRPGFLPLMVELLRHLGPEARLPQSAVAPGTTVTIPTPSGADRVVVVDPAGARHEGPDAEAWEFDQTAAPGPYRVLPVADGVRSPNVEAGFVVAPPTEESDLRPAPPSEEAAERGLLSTEVGGATVRRSIAPWLFLLAGILAILEAILRSRRPLRAA